jgi:molybdate transport system substrate-binding protein
LIISCGIIMTRFHLLCLSCIIIFFLTLSHSAGKVEGREKTSITVAAASSLRLALPKIAEEFEESTGIKVIISYGSSGMFAQQIENGAPFDLFLSADVAYLERLKRQNLVIGDSIQTYALGRIVLAVNRESGIKAAGLDSLRNPDIRTVAIANHVHAPYGLAAKEALVRSGLWQELLPKIVFGENVRQTLQFIQTGNAEAGIVALSIANVPQVSYFLIDEELHSPIEQALAIVKDAKNKADARAFIAYINSPESHSIMREYGFLPPGENFDTRP